MYKQNKIIAIITARGGSKGIEKKNIKPLGGKPLICWTIEAALKSRYIDRVILSSDDKKIIDIALKAGCDVPFVRPKELATDCSSSIDVVLHALESITEHYDYFILLQPTSPFRKTEHIDQLIEECFIRNKKMMVSIAKLRKHPDFMYKIDGGYLRSFGQTIPQLRRQDMPKAYEHNGAIYMAEISYFKKVKSFTVGDVAGFEMFGNSNLDIDIPDDWFFAEYLIEKGRI